MQLILVESPTKARTLTRFLKGKYIVEATMGHIRDLPKSELGVDVEHNFAPRYVIPRDKAKRVGELKALAKKATSIILATDPDREGEAIAWHIATILANSHQPSATSKKTKSKSAENGNLPASPLRQSSRFDESTTRRVSEASEVGLKAEDFKRIVFHEITESAIAEALAHPRAIDLQLVNAQQARRILDRLVGYNLSPLLWAKLSKRWLSAGRVQSVTVRLTVEREREIEKFEKKEFWTIEGSFTNAGAGESSESKSDSGPPAQAGNQVIKQDQDATVGSALMSKPNNSTLDSGNQHIKIDHFSSVIVAQLVAKDGKKYEETLTFDLFDGKYTTTNTTIRDQENVDSIIKDLQAPFVVTAVDKKEVRRAPAAPFTTSTLQQEAGRRFYFSAKKTMQLAQKLYEEGVITYHRTDSVNLAEKFLTETRDFIAKVYGKEYVADKPRIYHTKSKVAQEAHEAIRPTNLTVNSAEVTEYSTEFNRDHVRLYELIWKRAVACQAKEAIFDSTTIVITSANAYAFETQGSVVKFDGFLKIIGREIDEVIIPRVTVGEKLVLQAATPTQHFTNPPPRYTEASLVKTLEEKDIGRPSTYAPIISTIQDRQYVIKEEKKLLPTELGIAVTDFLVKYFPEIMDLPFTAKMEGNLDAIANGQTAWEPVIREFYVPFAATVTKTGTDAEKVKVVEVVIDEKCPTCGSPLVIRMGRYGKFVACTTFPTCKFTRQFAEKIDMKCPRCAADIVVKKTRRGKTFYGCSKYPDCTFAAWKKEDIK